MAKSTKTRKKKPRKTTEYPGPRFTPSGEVMGYLTRLPSGKSAGKDRSRISGREAYEVYYVARKFGVSADTVRKVIKRVGNSRKKVYAVLEKL